ncbi:MAG: type 1 glutamine amidotransferase [Planctomycetota bacterium]|jgi:type 1 glutamine amidotransferase
MYQHSSMLTSLVRKLGATAFLFCSALCLSESASAVQIDRQAERLPVLLVSGQNNHDWEWTHLSLASILEESGLFDVTISLDPATDLANAELLASVRAIVLDYNGESWGEAANEAFVQAVDMGLGLTIVHAANNPFKGWAEYESIVGHLWREGTGHGSFHPFDVEVIDRTHPITAQFPDMRGHSDELYHKLVNTQHVSRQVLAEAYSDPETGGTGEREPMVIVGRYGAGRIFHTPLGHVWPGNESHYVSHTDPQFRQMIVRGTEWAARGHVSDYDPDAGIVPPELASQGWRSLFDGETTAGWRSLAKEGFPTKGWSIVDRCLVRTHGDGGGDIITAEAFGDFEFSFEFLVTPGANSGVKIGIEAGGPALGPEFQVVDDAGHRDGAVAKHSSGAIYGVVAADAETKLLHPAARWNRARIMRRGSILEHWLNGRLTARMDTASEAWSDAIAQSKFRDTAGFGQFTAGHILLQDHGDEVWYRNLFLREYDSTQDETTAIFDGKTLGGWTAYGDAIYEVDGGSLVGRTGGGGQSFLVSDAAFENFIFEVDLKNQDAGNSGLQFRSHLNPKDRLFGYQMEFDPSERSWSGGLYDEYRRGWIHNLEHNPAGRAAMQRGQWNTYRIEANGPWLRASVNGIPTMDVIDPLDASGHFGLQVHSGNNTHIRWRNMRLHELPPLTDSIVAGPWNGPPGNSRCPLSLGEEHGHIFRSSPVASNGIFSMTADTRATRVGIARTLDGGQVGMAVGTPGFRFLKQIAAGGLVFDETIAFAIVSLTEGKAREVTASYLESRFVLHRGGERVLDTDVPPSRWGSSLQLFQCLEAGAAGASDSTDSNGDNVSWRGY